MLDLRPITLTTDDWDTVLSHPLSDPKFHPDYVVAEPCDVEAILLAAQEALEGRAVHAALSMITVFDATDPDTMSLMVVVDMPNGLSLASRCIELDEFFPPDGQEIRDAAFRYVLRALLGHRNVLYRQYARATRPWLRGVDFVQRGHRRSW